MKKPYLEAGRIVSVTGLKGEVRVDPWTDSPEVLVGLKTLYFEEGARPVRVERAREQKNVAVLKLEGTDDVDAANGLRGKLLDVRREDFPLEEGSYFIQDLIWLRAVDADDPSIEYGILKEVSPTGANDVYHIVQEGKTVLIPAIRQVIVETDPDQGIMRIRPLEGLFDAD